MALCCNNSSTIGSVQRREHGWQCPWHPLQVHQAVLFWTNCKSKCNAMQYKGI